MDKRIISIIGVGEVGALAAALLISKFTHTVFNLVDINASNIHGRLLDLTHAAAAQNNSITINDDNLLCLSEVIIYTAGYGNSAGVDRNSVAGYNKEIAQQIFKGNSLPKTSIIIVITNPVELISFWISEIFNHEILVIGTGTSLDTFRLQFLLAKYLDVEIDTVKALVLGEHGKHMIPIFSKCQLSNQNILPLLSKEKKETILSKLKMSATTIRKTESATKYGVSEGLRLIVESFIGDNQPRQFPLSIKINSFYKKLLNVQEDIFISLLCEVRESEVVIVNSSDYDTEELNELKLAANALKNLLYLVN